MSIWEATASALSAIWTNKMRSFLTMLGIIIGIFSVAVLISVVQSATNYNELSGKAARSR